ncbi:MAG: OmpA family protein [Planctomycetota bacterium]
MGIATPRSLRTCVMIVAAACLTTGCQQNPYLAAPGAAAWQPNPAQVSPVQAQIAELNRRVQLLDDNNRQLTTQLAQSEQRAQVYQEELQLVRSQLADTASQFESAKLAARNAETRAQSLQASTRLRGGGMIRPNTNLSQLAGRLQLGGLPVLQDGDKVRVVIPADQLFQPGTANLLPQSASILDNVAAQLKSLFPRQRIDIEGHTDTGDLYGGQVATSHQLASAQASAVLDFLQRRSGMQPQQLSIVAHGFNRPRESNATPAGRAANRRIELVIRSESF